MQLLIRIAVIICLASATAFASGNTAHASGTVLTVAGEVSKPNRDGLHEFTDAFLNFQQKSFDKARGFSSDDLGALPQVTVTARAESWPGTLSLSGPRLSDVMAAAGVATDATLGVMAIDGYTAELDGDARAAQEWILATHMGGKPLALGGRGPVWLLHANGGEIATDEVEALWVWSVIYIEAQVPGE